MDGIKRKQQTDGAGVEFKVALDRCLHTDDVREDHSLKDVLDAEGHQEHFWCGKPLQAIRISSAQPQPRFILIYGTDQCQSRHGVILPPSGHCVAAETGTLQLQIVLLSLYLT